METQGLTPTKTRRERKKSPPPYLGKRKNPNVAKRLKELWADPEWRAATEAKNREAVRRKIERAKETGQTWTRLGVPDGMRKEQAQKLWKKAERKAKKTMAELKEAGALDGLDPRAEEALGAAITIMRSPSNTKLKLDAARLVLDFTKSKPVSKKELTLNKAEQWLKQIAEDEDDEEPSGNAEEAA